MKSSKLLIVLAMLALALGVLTATAYAAPTGPETGARAAAPAAPAKPAHLAGGGESLSGSFVVLDPSVGGDTCYIPGVAQTFCFRAESFTNDYEYVYNLWQRFPTDWTVTNVYVQGTPVCDSGANWGAFSWTFETPSHEVNIAHVRYQQPTDHCTAYYCFEVVSGGGAPDALESWYWEGDNYNNPPHHPCSNDVYTPASMAGEPCDEWINPQASIPPCQPQPYEWAKYIDGQPWQPGFQITVQTSDTIQITEIVTTGLPFSLVENWDPAHLSLLGWEASAGTMVYTDTGFLEWYQPPGGPGLGYIIKWFHVEPCTWESTMLNEVLFVEGQQADQRPFFINKLPAALWIDAVYEPGVLSGFPASFTLLYGNDGGFENAFAILNEFPPEAPFVSSVPPPNYVDPNGLWAQWNLTDLPQGAQGSIDVTVMIQPGLPVSTTIGIWDGIYDHILWLRDSVIITFHVDPAFEWIKLVNGTPWDPGMVVTVQTSDTIVIQDTVTSPLDYYLVENWNPAHLLLTNWTADCGTVIVEPGHLEWSVVPGMPPCTLTKWFHVEPCTWTDTLLEEVLAVDSLEPVFRPVQIVKLPPALWIDAVGGGDVLPGQPANFTLLYGNNGGFENDVMIRNEFPPEAPFVTSDPQPDRKDPAGLWAEWDIAGLPMGDQDSIDVTVQIQPSVPPSTTIMIWDGIFDHTGELRGEVIIPFHVEQAFEWIKLVNGTPWNPDMVVTVQTSDTIVITDTVASPLDYYLVENWNPAHLLLTNWTADCGTVIVEPGHLEWSVVPGMPPCTLTKWFHVEPCTWTDTLLEEVLVVDSLEPVFRPVPIVKLPPALWIDAVGGGPVFAGQQASFTLLFGNDGGFENDVMIRNEFPPEAPFVASAPPPTRQDPNGLWVEWDFPGLPQGMPAAIDVTVQIMPSLPPSTTINIWDGIFDHTGELRDSVVITYHVEPPPLTVEWEKFVDGMPWTPDMEITRQTSDTIEVVEVIHIVSPPVKTVAQWPIFDQIETWDPTKLHLVNWTATGGTVVIDPAGQLVWSDELVEPTTMTLTKWFHVEPCTWTVTTLWEELWVDGVEVEQRPVIIHKLPPNLWIDAVGGGPVWAGRQAQFSLLFGNTGGLENDVMIRNDFPPEAPFVASTPPPSRQDPGGLWAEWDIAGLPQGAQGTIDVTVLILPTLPPSTMIEIWDGIFDHTGELRDWVIIPFHVARRIYLPVVFKNYAPGP